LIAAWLLGLEAEVRRLPPMAAFGLPVSMDPEQAAATGRVLAAAVRSEWRAGLLIMADLSARRTAKAPATFHPAAEEFDRRIGDIVGKGEVARLLDVDAEQAAELRTGGMAALWLLAGALGGAGTLRGEVLDERAPFGVGYLVGILESR
jgi:aromatic ring-opening dioxygenase LigB subunit